jgi:hypothetical protein
MVGRPVRSTKPYDEPLLGTAALFCALIGTALVYAFMQSSRPAAVVLVDILILVAASIFWSPYAAVGACLPEIRYRQSCGLVAARRRAPFGSLGLARLCIRSCTCSARMDVSYGGRASVPTPSARQSSKCASVVDHIRPLLRAGNSRPHPGLVAACEQGISE